MTDTTKQTAPGAETIDTDRFRILLDDYYKARLGGYASPLKHCEAALIAHINAWSDERCNAVINQLAASPVAGWVSVEDAKDAARYRYIRDTGTLDTAIWDALEGHGSVNEDGGMDQVGYAAGMDRAIDAAMSAPPAPASTPTQQNQQEQGK